MQILLIPTPLFRSQGLRVMRGGCLLLALAGLPGWALPAETPLLVTPASSPGRLADEAPPAGPIPESRAGREEALDGADPAAILQACWTPAQLAGSPRDRIIQRGLKHDPAPPPDWAIRAAETALPPLSAGLRGSIRSVEPADPQAHLVALTFDLCEQANERAGYDAELVATLREQGVKATFFASGKWLRTHPEQAMQLMADPRFEIGNHAWTHANLRVVSGPEARDQILWTQAQYQVLRRELAERSCARAAGPAALERIPEWPAVLRFPYGTCNLDALETTAGLRACRHPVVRGHRGPRQGPERPGHCPGGPRRGQTPPRGYRRRPRQRARLEHRPLLVPLHPGIAAAGLSFRDPE
ncbi:MAG: polysaccharide deacetylase family protein [Chromatiaceae bacterium]|nr:polysaccharide deacetylase family protein [Chromatiaceae bacterium]